jgi:hypothetical protein
MIKVKIVKNLHFGKIWFVFVTNANFQVYFKKINSSDIRSFEINIILVNLLDSHWLKTVPIKH